MSNNQHLLGSLVMLDTLGKADALRTGKEAKGGGGGESFTATKIFSAILGHSP